jgi:hypothetical protein
MYSKTIRAGLLTALMLFGCVAGAHAQEVATTITPEKRALLKELFEVSGLTQNVNSMMDMMITQNEKDLPNILAQATARNKTMTPQERAALEQKVREGTARANRRLREALQRLNYTQAIEDTTAFIFDKHFTESEIREWVTFYKSPVGKKTVDLMPVMMSESMAKINESLFPKLQEEIGKIIADEAKQLEEEMMKPAATQQPTPKANNHRRRRH